MRDAEAVKHLASTASVAIPDHSRAQQTLTRSYMESPLRKFHTAFYREEHDPPEDWPRTYDRAADTAMLPACVRSMLENPNDALLRPALVQRLVRVFLSLGWHPRHIAGLIRSKYERDHGWGDQWKTCDPSTRADFYARVFSGLFLTGIDDLISFNCRSAQEAGLCFTESCGMNLADFRDRLLERRGNG